MQNSNSRTISKRPRFSRRRGYTLIHCLVTILVLATVSTISVHLIRSLLRTERQGIAHITRLSSLSRLSRTFRTDAHTASTCEPLKPSDNGVFRLTMPNHETVVYARHNRGITRTQQKGDRVISQNLFRLSDAQLRFERASDEAAIVTLVVGLSSTDFPKAQGEKAAGTPPGDRPPAEFRVDAHLGRNALKAVPFADPVTNQSPN